MEQFEQFIEDNKNSISISDSKQHNVLVFAFVGDAIFTLFVRTYYASKNTYKAGILHTLTSEIVNAGYQSKLLDEIYDKLNAEEIRIAKTSRNEKTHNIAKNSSLEDYKKATSFEAVLGYLYLTNKIERLNYLLSFCLQIMENKDEH